MDTNILKNLDLSVLDKLTPAERELALSMLEEYSESGTSQTLNKFVLEDYTETPVDILTFVDDYNYLGNAWHDKEGNSSLYPYWRKELVKIFPDAFTTTVNNGIFSGSRGRGKSEICSLIGAYLLHRILCLKDPVEYFHLKPTEKIVFAFMNIKLALAEEIGIAKFQNTLQSSPWFMSHGTLEGRTKKLWVPKKFNGQEAIDIKIGSQSDDLIGLPVFFCLDGDTTIWTSKGFEKLSSLVGKDIQVPSLTDDGKVVLSDTCTVKQTVTSDIEYQIELEDGTIIKCTPNHRFRLIDGTYKEAQNLTEADEIMDFDPYGYVYKTTNILNNKIYIGQKKATTLIESYLGSGNLIKKAILKYGKENFKVEILEYCPNKDILNQREKYYIDKFDSRNTAKGYNIATGGQGGDLGEIAKSHISEALKNRPKSTVHKEKISKTLKSKYLHMSEARRIKISQANLHKVVSDETKAKMSIAARNSWKNPNRNRHSSRKDKIAINDGVSVRYIDKATPIPEGWCLGNCKTSGKHDMSRYYESSEMQLRKSISHQGVRNAMYGKGYLRKGGNNTNATVRYFYKDLIFECRKDLINYLKTHGFYNISENAIRRIINNSYGVRIKNKFSDLIKDLTWEFKNENI